METIQHGEVALTTRSVDHTTPASARAASHFLCLRAAALRVEDVRVHFRIGETYSWVCASQGPPVSSARVLHLRASAVVCRLTRSCERVAVFVLCESDYNDDGNEKGRSRTRHTSRDEKPRRCGDESFSSVPKQGEYE
ncbi:hypothetical protein PybrP1_011084 [[Pythium] brassicae (nom. inval.)]|nr:hypothetical protein PybrP1_011084 [[Pythium] brassicae (nom. inval.)]